MIKQTCSIIFLVSSLVFSGCGTDSTAENNLKTQQMWDDNDYEGIISSLESKQERSSEDNMRLGNAYMNAANLSFTDLAVMISDSKSRSAAYASSRSYSNSSYALFAQKVENNVQASPEALEYLAKAVESFSLVDDATSIDENNVSISTLVGAAQTAQATTAFSYLGDISRLLSNGVDYELLASACAIYHVYGYPNEEFLHNSMDDCLQTQILTTPNNTNNYKEMLVTLSNGLSYKRLLTLSGKNVILSDGYLDEQGVYTSDAGNGQNTPKMVDDESLTIQNALVMSLNEGFDNILAMFEEDIRDEVQVYKDEIDSDGDGVITSVELSSYISLQIQN